MRTLKISKWMAFPLAFAGIAILSVFFFIILKLSQGTYPEQNTNWIQVAKKRVCPEAWYMDLRPPTSAEPEQYFIIFGKKEKITDYDTGWIKENCKINKPETIY